MTLLDEFAKVRNNISTGQDEIDETIDYEDLEIDLYTSQGYLVIESDVDGDPQSPKAKKIAKDCLRVFGEVMLPDPNTGTCRCSIDISEIDQEYEDGAKKF